MPKTVSTTPLMAIRLRWQALDARNAFLQRDRLADQLRGCVLEALRPQHWTVHWTVWQGKSEAKQSPSSTLYGCTLWVHPA